VTIVWAILPRPDRFVPPGPSVTALNEPPLFELLTEVATATRQEMPAEVYFVNDVNAFVAQRGGIMGFGSRRVMGLGLPLMQAVTVQELKGIIAHEFGHYHAGDVRIGPWIYKTRAAIGRTIEQLSNSVLQKVFIWYGHLFLRVTHAVSRRQEFIADEVAARVAGANVMAAALRNTHGAALGFQSYWQNELGPVLNSGYLPPMTAGFDRFMQAEGISARLQHAVRTEEAEGATDPLDTHPPLRERVAALSALPHGEAGDTRPAVSLLSNPALWERRLLGVAINEDWARSLKPLGWDKVIETVYVPMWRAAVKENAANLREMTPVTLPFARSSPLGAAGQGTGLDVDGEAAAVQVRVVTIALSLALHELGWIAMTSPGEEIVFRREGHEVRPFSDLSAVAKGEVSADAWNERCVALGIANVPLIGRAGV
jgi:Zn-dependent protease with chaperone function